MEKVLGQKIENIDSWIKDINSKLEDLKIQLNSLTTQYHYIFSMLITTTEILADLENNGKNNMEIINLLRARI